jgi:GNAT superfamily N-acetyltransferase
MKLYLDQYAALSGLFQPLRYNLVIDSIIDGNTPGWVFADRGSAPTSGLMWDRQDALLAAGAPDDELIATIQNEILPDARRRWIPELCFFSTDSRWEDGLMRLLSGVTIEKANRYYYRFGGLKVNWQEALPDGFLMRRIDPFLLQNDTYFNSGEVAGWVSSFWATFEDFTRTGFGFCVLEEDVVVSWCLTVFASRDQRELGLATVPEYRGKGLATATAAACLAHCLAQGYTPHWHCWEDNRPSQLVAEKVGFTDPVRYQVLRLNIGSG